jgi:beta-N-acetylhexosaminidase
VGALSSLTNTPKAIILSVAGPVLSGAESALFADTQPLGFILFKRNIENPDQLRTLTSDLRASVGRDCPILIDQEGGRVQRMNAPHWPQYPSAQDCIDVPGTASAIAADLVKVGIDVNCVPVLDILFPETHQAIGNRAYGSTPEDVFTKGKQVIEACLAAGVTPVMKHMPGQGRAAQDSHYDLPLVAASLDELRASDFLPFERLTEESFIPQVWGMVSHILYRAVDPDHPASVSAKVIDLIRKELHFDGLLLSDDVSMGALSRYGEVEDRCKAMLAAGCDIALYCAGKLEELEKVAPSAPRMSDKSVDRYERSRIRRRSAA